jgi:hypothetical protein
LIWNFRLTANGDTCLLGGCCHAPANDSLRLSTRHSCISGMPRLQSLRFWPWRSCTDPSQPVTTVNLRATHPLSVTSRSWRTSTCPFPTMVFVKCLPVIRHWTSRSVLFERWLSWPPGVPRSCSPFGGDRSTLLTLVDLRRLTAEFASIGQRQLSGSSTRRMAYQSGVIRATRMRLSLVFFSVGYHRIAVWRGFRLIHSYDLNYSVAQLWRYSPK